MLAYGLKLVLKRNFDAEGFSIAEQGGGVRACAVRVRELRMGRRPGPQYLRAIPPTPPGASMRPVRVRLLTLRAPCPGRSELSDT